jgi:hypothetical protein
MYYNNNQIYIILYNEMIYYNYNIQYIIRYYQMHGGVVMYQQVTKLLVNYNLIIVQIRTS